MNFADKSNTEADKPTKIFLGRGKKKGERFNIHKINTGNQVLCGDAATTHMEEKFRNLLGNESPIDQYRTVEDFLLDSETYCKKLQE
jgi:hypothetical protein